MSKGFDRLASVYDSLVKLVFGDTLQKAQCSHIASIESNDHVLVLGGGTGWILNSLFHQQKSIRITYVDYSEAMIAKAKATVLPAFYDQVKFIKGTYEDLPSSEQYDVVCTAFYLDMFTNDEAQKIIKTVKQRLNDHGRWLFTDFRNSERLSQRLLIQLMYLFFRAICGISASKLANFEKIFIEEGMVAREHRYFGRKMIESIIYCNRE